MARGLVIAFLLSFGPTVSNAFARFAYALLLPAMRSDLGWTWSQAGSINTMNAAGYLAGALLARVVAARLGNRRSYVLGMLVTSLAILATGLTRDFHLLIAARVLAGIGAGAVFIGGGALSGNVFPDRPRLATTTIAIFYAGAGIGLMISGVAIPWLLERRGDASWPLVWQAMGWASLVMGAASAWAALAIAEPAGTRADARWRILPFAAEFAAYALFAVGYIGYMTFIIAWMRGNGADTFSVATVWFVLGLATLLAPLVWRRAADTWSGGKPLAAAMAVLAAGALLPLLWTSFAAMLASAALFGSAMFSIPAAITSFVKRSLPKAAWGGAIAVFTAVFAAGQIVGPWGTGWLADRYGSLAPGLGGSVALLALGAVIALLQRDLATRAGPSGAHPGVRAASARSPAAAPPAGTGSGANVTIGRSSRP